MIQNLQIKNFKLFNQLEAQNIPQLLLITGANSCGKTSLLEAVFLALNMTSADALQRHLIWRGCANAFDDTMQDALAPSWHKMNLKNPLQLNFTINQKKVSLKLTYLEQKNLSNVVLHPTAKADPLLTGLSNDNHQIEVSCSINDSPYSRSYLIKAPLPDDIARRHGIEKNVSVWQLGPTEQLQKYQTTLQNFAASFALAQHISADANNQETVHMFSKMDEKKNTPDFIQALQIIEPDLQSISSLSPSRQNQYLFADIANMERKIPLALVGDGTNRLANILLRISDVAYRGGGVCLIDEIENGFHHLAQAKVWHSIATHAQKHNVQVIGTCHSFEFITQAVQGLPEDMKNKFGCLRIERQKDSFNTISYSYDEACSAIQNNFEMR